MVSYLEGVSAARADAIMFFTGETAGDDGSSRFLHVHGRNLLDDPTAGVIVLGLVVPRTLPAGRRSWNATPSTTG